MEPSDNFNVLKKFPNSIAISGELGNFLSEKECKLLLGSCADEQAAKQTSPPAGIVNFCVTFCLNGFLLVTMLQANIIARAPTRI